MPAIDILLATYNGAVWLPDQLASLAAQTFKDWRVILRDDGSCDGSLDVVRRWAEAGGHDLVVIGDGRRNLGARGNFAALLEASDAPWFACCDQDDVWLPGKLEGMLRRLQEAEVRGGADVPLLVCGDAQMVDADLQPLHRSFRAFAGWHQPSTDASLRDLLQQCIVLGCASLGNAALRRIATPIPPEAVMHDWWLALVAATAGKLVSDPEASVLYRQHGTNTSGPVDWSPRALLGVLVRDPAAGLRRARSFALTSQRQALALERHLVGRVPAAALDPAVEYGALLNRPFWARKAYALRHPAPGASLMRRVVVGLCL